jgi:hypothetical protein
MLSSWHWNPQEYSSLLEGHKDWNFTLFSIIFFEFDRIMLPSPRGPSKRYTNLVIWSRPRVNNYLCLSFHFLSSWLSSSSHWLHFCSSLEVSTESSKLSDSIVTVLPASQVTLVFYQLLSSTTAVILKFSGCGCLLTTPLQRVYEDLFKFNGLYSALLKFNVVLKFKVLFKVYSSLKQLFNIIHFRFKVSIKVYPTSTFLRIYWSILDQLHLD